MAQAGKRTWARVLALLTAVLVVLVLAAPATAAASLQSTISSILTRHQLSGAGTGVAVYDLSGKRALYSLHWDSPLLPASNEKLVTSATALGRWTGSHRFTTQLLLGTPHPTTAGTLAGDVFLKGFGDPTLSTSSFQARHFKMATSDLTGFVKSLRTLGVKRIAGRVRADDGYFDQARTAPTWRPGMGAYCGPLSALTLNEGFGPSGGYVGDPSVAAAAKLTSLLRAAGIAVDHAAARGRAPASAAVAFVEYSATLSRVLAAMNKPSDNFLAEELLKGLGAHFGGAGTTYAGTRVATDYLKSLGIATGFRLRDGSGLSHTDRLSAHAVIKLLGAMSRRPDFALFRDSLAVAGVDGTLAGRMRGTAAQANVHAKTGTLAAASCLSGYVTSASGHALSFSILMNGGGLSLGDAIAAQDAIAVALAGSRQ